MGLISWLYFNSKLHKETRQEYEKRIEKYKYVYEENRRLTNELSNARGNLRDLDNALRRAIQAEEKAAALQKLVREQTEADILWRAQQIKLKMKQDHEQQPHQVTQPQAQHLQILGQGVPVGYTTRVHPLRLG